MNVYNNGFYETSDYLSLNQAQQFIKIVDTEIGVETQLNESIFEEHANFYNYYYVLVSELETDKEFLICLNAERAVTNED
tara:strand:- start:1319 stop:1558 length:240 start_codon:yes stop_codon:yes gene_type:complete